MKTIQVADFKAKFSDVIKQVQEEKEEYVIQYGRKHKKVAVLIPYESYAKNKPKIVLGLLKDKSYVIKSDFEMTEAELLGIE